MSAPKQILCKGRAFWLQAPFGYQGKLTFLMYDITHGTPTYVNTFHDEGAAVTWVEAHCGATAQVREQVEQ
ncbi:MAG: hypothetical protein JO069_12770 [Verrucomicrobia bacterium]|nr:hypothetical protein [Verrucomicrobiota bacterium]